MDYREPPHTRTLSNFADTYLHPKVLRRLAAFLAISLPLVWTWVALEHARLRKIAQVESNRGVQNLARAFAEEVGSTINTVDVALSTLRHHWNSDNHAQFASMVRQLNMDLKNKVMFQLAVTDARGVMQFLSSGPFAPGFNIGDREHVAAVLHDHRDRLVISHPVVGRMTGTLGVRFARPILAPDGELAGVIVASVEPGYFSRFYDHIDLGKDASTALVRRGVVLARSSSGGSVRHVGATLSGPPYDNSDKAEGGTFRRVSRLDGIDRFYGWRRVPHYDMIVTVGQAVAQAELRFASQQRFDTLMGLTLSAALLVLGWGTIAAGHHRRMARKALASAESRWKMALTATGAGVWDWDVRSGEVMFTSGAQSLLGIQSRTTSWTTESVSGKIHPDDLEIFDANMRDMLEGRTADFRVEHRIMRGGDEAAWVLARAMVVERGDDGAPLRVVGTVVDIDERKAHEAQIRHLASHDGLTGLANRALFGDRLQQAILLAQREKNRLAVIYFDLDKFKPVNDTYGHAVGDQLLAEVASRVRSNLRQSDTLARLGGDEFAVLLPVCASAGDAVRVGAGILAQLNQPFIVDGHALDISGSVGVSLYPDSGADAATLVHHADLAMYRSKQDGRNRVTLFGAEQA